MSDIFPPLKVYKLQISFLLFIVVLVLRAIGVAYFSILLYPAFLIFLLNFIFSSDQKIHFNQRIIVSSFLLLAFAFIQYLIPLKIFPSIVLVIWTGYLILTNKSSNKGFFNYALYFTISFLLLSAVLFNPRQFHNFYRSTTYEEYIRSAYSELMSPVADLYIDKYKKIDTVKSNEYLNEAMLADSLKDYMRALDLYNKSIDENPDNPVAYHRRGFLKLNTLDLDLEIAYSAVKDFNRAIKLDTTFTMAYYHRSIALGYLNKKGRSFLDRKVVWEKDSVLSEEDFKVRYGVSKKSFLIPFNS